MTKCHQHGDLFLDNLECQIENGEKSASFRRQVRVSRPVRDLTIVRVELKLWFVHEEIWLQGWSFDGEFLDSSGLRTKETHHETVEIGHFGVTRGGIDGMFCLGIRRAGSSRHAKSQSDGDGTSFWRVKLRRRLLRRRLHVF